MLGSGKRPDDRPGRKLCARAPSSLRRGCHLHVSRDRYFASWVIKRQFVRFLSPASSPRPKRATVLSLRIASRCDDRTSAVICVPWPSWSGYPSRRAPHASWYQRQYTTCQGSLDIAPFVESSARSERAPLPHLGCSGCTAPPSHCNHGSPLASTLSNFEIAGTR